MIISNNSKTVLLSSKRLASSFYPWQLPTNHRILQVAVWGFKIIASWCTNIYPFCSWTCLPFISFIMSLHVHKARPNAPSGLSQHHLKDWILTSPSALPSTHPSSTQEILLVSPLEYLPIFLPSISETLPALSSSDDLNYYKILVTINPGANNG